MENLEDFRYYFTEEKEIDAFVATEESLTGMLQRIQVARVRRAWSAARHNGVRRENRNTVSSVAENDDLIDEGTLKEVRVSSGKDTRPSTRWRLTHRISWYPASSGKWISASSLSTT